MFSYTEIPNLRNLVTALWTSLLVGCRALRSFSSDLKLIADAWSGEDVLGLGRIGL